MSKENTMNKIVFVSVAMLSLSACDDATIASQNISKAADNFEVTRRIVFENTWTGEVMSTIEGRCNIVAEPKQLEVTCKLGPEDFRKFFLGLHGHATYQVDQLEPLKVGVYHFRRTFKPQAVIPDIDFRGGAAELLSKSDATD